jgi:hypothetical protein
MVSDDGIRSSVIVDAVSDGAVVSITAAGSALNSHKTSERSLRCFGSHGKTQPPALGQRKGRLQHDGPARRIAAHVFVVFAVVGVAPQELPGETGTLHTIEIGGRVVRPPTFIIRHATTPALLGLKQGMPLPVAEYLDASSRAEVTAVATRVATPRSVKGDGIGVVL